MPIASYGLGYGFSGMSSHSGGVWDIPQDIRRFPLCKYFLISILLFIFPEQWCIGMLNLCTFNQPEMMGYPTNTHPVTLCVVERSGGISHLTQGLSSLLEDLPLSSRDIPFKSGVSHMTPGISHSPQGSHSTAKWDIPYISRDVPLTSRSLPA
jgi:hypothetical protein